MHSSTDNFNLFGKIADMLPDTVAQANASIADRAVDNIKARIIANGQVETGEMLNSVHTEAQSDGTQNVVIDAKNEEGEYYAQFPNYGTVYQPANPFFEPGLDDTQPDIDTALQAILSAIGNALS